MVADVEAPNQQMTADQENVKFATATCTGLTPTELYSALQALANERHFSLHVTRSDHKKEVGIISCDRSGNYQPNGKKR